MKNQMGLPEEMSCGGQFRQCFYEDRRVYNIIKVENQARILTHELAAAGIDEHHHIQSKEVVRKQE